MALMISDPIKTPTVFVPIVALDNGDRTENSYKRKTTIQMVALIVLQAIVLSTVVILAALFIAPYLTPSVAVTAIVALTVASSALTLLIYAHFSKIKEVVITIIQYIVATFIEFGAVLVAATTFPYDLTKKNPTTFTAPVQSTPVLCVHGYMHRSPAFILLRNRLLKQGVGPVYTINLGSPTCKSIKDDYSHAVDRAIKDIQKKTGRKDIFLIGHSMGGVVITEYIVNIAKDVIIKGAATLGSPLHGTKNTCIAPGRCAREMAYQSAFLREQQEKLSKSDVPFLHISSSADLLIQPTSSAEGSSAPIQERMKVKWTGHAGLLYSSSIANRIVEFYKKTQ